MQRGAETLPHRVGIDRIGHGAAIWRQMPKACLEMRAFLYHHRREAVSELFIHAVTHDDGPMRPVETVDIAVGAEPAFRHHGRAQAASLELVEHITLHRDE